MPSLQPQWFLNRYRKMRPQWACDTLTALPPTSMRNIVMNHSSTFALRTLIGAIARNTMAIGRSIGESDAIFQALAQMESCFGADVAVVSRKRKFVVHAFDKNGLRGLQALFNSFSKVLNTQMRTESHGVSMACNGDTTI